MLHEDSEPKGCDLAQEIDPSPEGHGKTVTMGEFVRDVFLEQVRIICLCRVFVVALISVVVLVDNT